MHGNLEQILYGKRCLVNTVFHCLPLKTVIIFLLTARLLEFKFELFYKDIAVDCSL